MKDGVHDHDYNNDRWRWCCDGGGDDNNYDDVDNDDDIEWWDSHVFLLYIVIIILNMTVHAKQAKKCSFGTGMSDVIILCSVMCYTVIIIWNKIIIILISEKLT